MSKHVRPASSLQSHRQDAASNLVIDNIKAAEGVLLGVLIAAAGTAMITVISAVLMMAALSSAP